MCFGFIDRDIRQALAFAISHDKADEGNQLDLRPIDTDSNSLLVHTGQGPVNDRATKLVGTEVRVRVCCDADADDDVGDDLIKWSLLADVDSRTG